MDKQVDWSAQAKGIVGNPVRIKSDKWITSEDEITDDIIEHARKVAADVVKQHGEQYLPIFERLCYEHEQREKTKALLEEAYDLAD